MGQSAGAHIAACALVEQAIKESDATQTTTWSVSQIKAYFGLSGGYIFQLIYVYTFLMFCCSLVIYLFNLSLQI